MISVRVAILAFIGRSRDGFVGSPGRRRLSSAVNDFKEKADGG